MWYFYCVEDMNFLHVGCNSLYFYRCLLTFCKGVSFPEDRDGKLVWHIINHLSDYTALQPSRPQFTTFYVFLLQIWRQFSHMLLAVPVAETEIQAWKQKLWTLSSLISTHCYWMQTLIDEIGKLWGQLSAADELGRKLVCIAGSDPVLGIGFCV